MSFRGIAWLMLTILTFMINSSIPQVKGKPQVPCYFIFGDSLVDNGNNNNLTTMAKANYLPYGIDFPAGPMGRFTNGRNKADYLAELLGFDNFIAPFSSARSSEILKGVNYGSGVAGILDETGYHWGDRISMNMQIQNHKVTVSRIISSLGNNVTSAKDLLSRCLYTIDIGNNDYINNYLQPKFYPTSRMYTPDQFATVLVQQFSQQLRTLYDYGARKVAVSNLGLLGCLPEELERYGRNASGCVDFINNDVQLYNEKLKLLIDDLNTNLPNARFIYINHTSISSGGSSTAAVLGITVSSSCCTTSNTTAKGQCLKGQVPCNNRDQYLFFDNYHPTETATLPIVSRSYNSLVPSDAYPTDISQLLQT